MKNIQNMRYEKMSQEHLVQIKDKTFWQFYSLLQKSKTKKYQFLNVKNEQTQEKYKEMDDRWCEDCSMLSIEEFPNEGEEFSLSAILMDVVQEKYYLSKKACQGILNRAERRGKILPEILKKALIYQSQYCV